MKRVRGLWLAAACLALTATASLAIPEWARQQCCRLTGWRICCEHWTGGNLDQAYWPE